MRYATQNSAPFVGNTHTDAQQLQCRHKTKHYSQRVWFKEQRNHATLPCDRHGFGLAQNLPVRFYSIVIVVSCLKLFYCHGSGWESRVFVRTLCNMYLVQVVVKRKDVRESQFSARLHEAAQKSGFNKTKLLEMTNQFVQDVGKYDTNVASLLRVYRAFFSALETLSYRHDYETVRRLESSECNRTELKVPFVHAGFEWRGSLEFTWHSETRVLKRLRFIIPTDGIIILHPSEYEPPLKVTGSDAEHQMKNAPPATWDTVSHIVGDNGLLEIYEMMTKWFPSKPMFQTVMCDERQRLELRAVDTTRHHFVVQFYVSFEQGYPIGPCYDAKKFTALPTKKRSSSKVAAGESRKQARK